MKSVSGGTLQLGPGLDLPANADTQTYGFLGKRGVGKTHAAAVLAEELLDHGCQVVVIDPIGVWWGLRSSADGKKDGYPILVMGGDHGDVPLEASAGRMVADFVVAKRASVVLDLGAMSKTDQSRFVADLLERVYQKNRAPLQIIIDEADAFAPQRIYRGGERCFGAVDTAVRRGRARGLGVTLVTQRSAAINKDVLTQIEVLIVFRTIAPQDRAAVEAWVEVHGDQAEAKALLKSLHELKVGECWIWSPAWLERLSRVQIRRRRTFDSSATPEAGNSARAPKAIAAVDVEAFRAELATLMQKGEAEDPRRLRARVADLERQLAAKPAALSPKLENARAALKVHINNALKMLDESALFLKAALRSLDEALEPGTSPSTQSPRTGTPRMVSAPMPATRLPGGLDRPSRAILTVLAQHGMSGCDRGRLTLLAGYRWSGGFRNALSSLRTSGLISGSNVGLMSITAEGLATLGTVEPLPQGDELREYWLRHPSLGAAERETLRVLMEAFPRGLTSEQVMKATGYSWSGGFRNALSKLRTAGLLTGRNTEAMSASEELFR